MTDYLAHLSPPTRKRTIICLYMRGELSFREVQALFAADPALREA